MQLNEEQMQAVNHLDGPCVVIANPGAGKCIVGESLVFGCKGSPIMSQIKEEDIDSIFSFSKETLNCSDLIEKEAYFINSGKHKTITVSTDYGFEIEGTENHPIAVLNNDGYLCWKQLCKINVGDICPIWTNKKINISNEFSKEYYLMGILLGDGCLGCGKYFTFHSEINSISDEFCKIIKELYGYNVGKGKDKRRKNLYRFYLTRNFIVNDLVNRFGDIRHGACEKYLTKEMLSGTDFEIRSLISGLFDTDGYVGKHEIEIILCTKKLIDQLHVLLLRFGVFSYKTIKYVNRKPYYRISIYGDDFRRFVKNIGFRHEEKKRKSLSNLFNIKTNPNKFIYNTKNLIRNIRGKINGKSFWKGHTGLLSSNEDSIRLTRYCTGTRHVTDLSVNRISKILKTYNIENESMQQLQFLSDNFTFSKVTKVNKKEELVNVYDYSVSDTHNFISNGFISHNTACITSRVVNLINNGVSPANILCLTFTNKASEEMRSRIASKTNNSDKIWISTFHKLCVAILRKYGKNIGLDQNFSILIESDQTDLIKKIFRMHEKETNDKLSSYLGNKINNFRENLTPLSEFISNLNNDDLSGTYSSIATEYLNTLTSYHAVDFSGILYQCHKLLIEHEKITRHLADKFKYILVDEWQDTNIIQYEIIKLISKYHNNLFAVGDAKQSLYSWRGSRPENLNKIFEDFQNTKKIVLPKNYRSTTNILRAAQNLIRHNKDSEDAVLESVRGPGEDVKVYQFETPDIESNFVCSKIKQLHDDEGMNYGDCAVLYRTNSLSKLIEQKCRYYGIPYKIVGGFSFYDRKEIKDIIAYLTLCANPYDSIAFHRAVSTPKRGIGDVAIGKIERACQQNKMNVFEVAEQKLNELDLSIKGSKALKEFCDMYKKIKGENLIQTTKVLLNESGYLNSLTKLDIETFTNRKENLSEFVASVSQFNTNDKENAVRDFLQYISLQNIEPEDETDKVNLMTVHSAKGLEYKAVWIIGAEQGLMPHILANAIEEERRIMFVAVTRSSDLLFVSYCKNRVKFSLSKEKQRTIKCIRSIFISEMIGEYTNEKNILNSGCS